MVHVRQLLGDVLARANGEEEVEVRGDLMEEMDHAWFAGLGEFPDAIEGVYESVDLGESVGEGGGAVGLEGVRSHAGWIGRCVLGWYSTARRMFGVVMKEGREL